MVIQVIKKFHVLAEPESTLTQSKTLITGPIPSQMKPVNTFTTSVHNSHVSVTAPFAAKSDKSEILKLFSWRTTI
jgi:hypothetical protein